MNGTMTWWLARGKRLSVHPHMDHLSPAAGQNLLRTTGGYSVKDRLHVVSMAPGNCRISWSSNNMISQKERKPSLLQQPYPSLRRFELALLRRMCMRICYVHFCCQPTPQLQNYSSP
ncbi:uncharacterized protein AAG666_013313 isoform 2-T2 [Megaptera novaeangliae]